MSNSKSQIYSMGYEKWEGERDRALPAWLLIGSQSLRNLVSSSGCLGRIIFGSFYVIYFFWLTAVTLVYFQWENLKSYSFFSGIAQSVDLDELLGNHANYHGYWIINTSLLYTFFTLLFYGSQLIAKDKRANAMQVYFSKAISRFDYLMGKFFAVSILTGSVTLLPSALILLMGVVFTPDHLAFFSDSWYIPMLSGVYWLLLTLILGSLTLMFSSFFTKSYMASVGFFGLIMFLSFTATLMVKVLGAGDMMGGLEIMNAIRGMGNAIYSLEVKDTTKLAWQVIDMTVLSGISILLVLRNIRPVEVVS